MPELIPNPYATPDSPENTDKLSTVASAKEDKLRYLSDVTYEKVTLQSLYDVDSPRFEGVTGGVGGTTDDGVTYDRSNEFTADRLKGIDSFEVFPSSEETLLYQTQDPNGMAKMAQQREALAAKLGVDPSTVTNEDVYERGARDALKTLAVAEAYSSGRGADYIQQVIDWEPSKDLTQQWRTSTPTFGSAENLKDLNIQVERAFLDEYGYYGRPLTQVRPVGSEQLLGQEGVGYEYYQDKAEAPRPPVTEEQVKEAYLRTQAENMGMGERIASSGSRFLKGVAKEAGVDFYDWVGESLDSATGGKLGWDAGTEEEKNAMLNKAFGINPYVAEKEFEQAKQYGTNIVNAIYSDDKDVDYSDVYELVKIGVTTPELFVDSASFIASTFIPFLGWGGKAAKADKVVKGANAVIKATEKSLKAGEISKDAAKAAVIAQKAKIAEATADVTIINKLTSFTQQNAGLMQVAAGNVNDQIDRYKKEQGAAPSVGKVAQMMATETLMLGLDRWVDLSILKAPLALKGTREAFSALTKEGKTKVLAKTVANTVGLAANMGKEAAQEYLQEIGQEFNVKFNFDDNTGDFLSAETLDEAKEVFLSKEMQAVGVTGAGLGAGGAVQFAGVGQLGNALGVTSRLAGQAGQKVINLKKTKTKTKEEPTIDPTTSEETLAAAVTEADKKANTTASKYAKMFSDTEAMAVYTSEDLTDEQLVETPSLDEALKKSGSSYADIITEIESAEVVIEGRKDTNRKKSNDDLVLQLLRKAKAQASQKVMESKEPITLGSGFSPEDVVETFIESKVNAQGVLDITPEEKVLVNDFLKKNGQKPYRFAELTRKLEGKDAVAVYEDSQGTAQNSAPNRRARLKRLVNTPGVNKSLVKKELDGIQNFLNTQISRKQEYDAVLKEVKADINRYNNAKTPEAKAVAPKSRDFGEGKFINVRKGSDGKFFIDPQSQAVIDSIEDTIDHLQTTLTRYRKATTSVIGESSVASQFVDVPMSTEVSEGIQKSRAAHKKYYDKRKPTKVIVDKDSSPKWWVEGGDYATLNESKLANSSTTFSSDDTVLLTTLDVKPGSVASKTLKKAIQAGATIVVDEPLAQEGRSKRVNTLARKYGAGVVEIDGITQWRTKSEADTIQADTAAKTKAKNREEAIVNRMVKAFDEVFIANTDKRLLTKEAKAEYYKAVEQAKEFFENDKVKGKDAINNMRKHAETKIKKEAELLTAELDKIMLAEGTNSKAYSEAIGKASKTAARIANIEVKAREQRLSKGGKLVTEWRDAEIEAKKGGKPLTEWVKETFGSTAKSVGINMIADSVGKAKAPEKVVYSYKVKGKNDYKQTTRFEDVENFSEDGVYHIIEVNPENYVQVSEATLLNTLNVEELKLEGESNVMFNEFVETSLTNLQATLAELKLGKGFLPFDLIDSPAASLIFNAEEKLNANFAVAARIALYNFVRNNAYMMTKEGKTEKDIAEILGKHESELSDTAIIEMQDKGLLIKTAADSVGKDIAKLLGLKAKESENIDAQMFQALTTEIGQIALLMGMQKNEGILEKKSMSSAKFAKDVLGKTSIKDKDSEAVVNFVNIKDQSMVDEVALVVSALDSVMPNLDVRRKEPSFKKLTDKEKKKATAKIRKEKLGVNIASDSVDAMNTLMDDEMIADMPLLRFATEEKNKLRIMKLLGWVELNSDEFNKLSYKEQQTQASKNRDIERNFENLEWLDSTTDKKQNKVSMWFKYFFSKNGRFFIDSNTINPQTNKHLDRFFVQPKAHWNNYVRKGEKFFVNGDDVTALVHYALAQGFGFATDKKSASQIKDFSETVIKTLKNKKELDKVREAFLDSGKYKINDNVELEIEHLGHALQSFKFLEDSFSGKFSSPITAEFDAVTSGFALKLLQMPIIGEKLYDWLSKVGIITKYNSNIAELGDEGLSMNNLLDLKSITDGKLNFLDSYQFLAFGMKPISYSDLQNNSKNNALLRADTGYAKNLWEAVSKVLPTVDPSGAISSDLRNLFKYPFMTFNYASSIKSIRGRLKVTMQDDIAKRIAKVDLTNVQEKEKPIVEMLKAFAETDELAVLQELQENVRKKDLKFVKVGKGASLGNYLDIMVDASYGVQVEEVLNKEFAPFVEAQDAINGSFRAMFEVFKIAFEEKLEEARKKGPVSAKKEKEIYESLKDKWPAIKGPLSSMEEEFSADGTIGVYSTETASPYGVYAGRKAAQTKVSKELKEVIGDSSIRTSHMIKVLGAAISAGSVIPIHYIDGAAMAITILSMKGGLTSIHDAIMPNLLRMGEAQGSYNKSVVDVSAGYSFIDEIVKSLDRIIKTTALTSEEGKTAYQTTKVVIDEETSMSVSSFLIETRNTMAAIANKSNMARNELFAELNKGAHVMHMAGTAEGVYHIDDKTKIEYTPIDRYTEIKDNTVYIDVDGNTESDLNSLGKNHC